MTSILDPAPPSGCQAASRSAGDVQYRSPLAPVGHVSRSNRAHRRAAIRDAGRLLAGVVPPSGAVVASASTGVGPHTLMVVGALNSAVARRSWTVPRDASAVLSYVTAHLPPGSKIEGTGTGGPVPMQQVDREWPPVRGMLGVRYLRIQVTSTGTDQTLLSAIAQSQWIVGRSRAQRIPPGVREIRVTSGVPRKPPFLSRTVSGPRRVSALVRLLNSRPLVQPTVTSCPADTGEAPIVTITFRTAASHRPIARARVSSTATMRWPASSMAWACFPTELIVRGGGRATLAGNVIAPLKRLLGVSLVKPPRR